MQSYDEVSSKYNKYLSGGQKKLLKQRAQAISLQNAENRRGLQAGAQKQLNRQNEYLSSMGLASNLRTAPSSGADWKARRMPEFHQQLQGLRAQEQGQLNPVGLQMANATIQAQIDAAKRAARSGPGGYKVFDPTTGKYVQDLKNGGDRIFQDKAEAQFMQSQLNDEARYKVNPGQVTEHKASVSQRNAGLIASLQREQQNLNAANAIAGKAFSGNAASLIGAGTAKTAESAVAEAGSDQRTRTVTVQRIGGVGADNIAKTIKGLFGGAVKAQGISRNDVQANDGKAIRQQNRDRENMTKVISYCRDAGIISAPSAARMMNDVTKGTANYPVMADYLTEQVTLNYCKGVETKAGQLFEAVNADIAGGYNSAAAQNVLAAYAKAQESGLTEDYAAVGQAYIDYVNDATDARIQAANGILLDYVHEGMPMQDAYRAQQAFKAGDIDGFTAVLEEYTERNQRGIVLTSVNRMEAAGAISKAEADTIREMAKNGDVAGAVQALADGSGQYYTEQLGNYGREAWKGIQDSGRYKAPTDPDKLEEYWNENNEYWAAKWAYEIADKTNTAEAWKNFFAAYGKLAEAENSQSNLEARLNLDDAKRYGMSKEEWEKGWEAWRTGNTDEYISVLENATLVGGQVGYFQAATRDYQLKNGFGIDLATYHKYDSLSDEQIQEGIDALNKRVWSLETYDRREDRANIEEMEAILRVREADRNTAVYERYKDLSLEQIAEAEHDVYTQMRSLFEKTNTYAWMNDADYWAYTQDPEGYLSKMGKAMAGIGYELEGADREAWNKVSTEWLMVNAAKTHQQSLKRAEDLKTMLETAKTEGGATYGASVLKIQRQGVEGIWGIHREKNWLGSEIWRDENGHKIGGDREDLLELYRALNMSTDEWGEAYADNKLGSGAQRDRATAWREFATDEQKEALNYYLATDLDKAAEFMKAMDTHVNEARMKDLQDRAAKQANEGKVSPVLMHMVTYATKPLDAIGGVYTLAQTLAGNDVDPYSAWFDFNVFNGTVRQEHYDALREATMKKLGSGAASASVFALQTLDSMIDSWVSAKIGGALTGGAAGWTEAITLPVMGLSAAAETEREALIKGIPQEQAKKLALCAGVFEALFEVVSLENILHGAEDLTKSAWFRMGVGGLIEGSEETFTEAANMVAEAVIMCGQDSFNADTAALMQKGYKKETAMALTALGQVKQVGMAGIGGLLSGLGSGSVNAVKANREIKKSGKNIRTNDRTEAVMTAAENSTDARVMELFGKVGEAYRNGSLIGDMDLGRINYALAMSDKATALGAIDRVAEEGKVTKKEAKTAREAIETLYEASGRSLESTLYGFDAARLSEAFGGINENALTAISETMFEVTNDRTNRLNEKREERLTREAEARVDENLTGAEREAAVAEMRKTVQKEQDDLKKARIERARSGVTTLEKNSPVLNKPVKVTEQYDGVEVRLHELNGIGALTKSERTKLDFIRAMAKVGNVNIVVHDTLGTTGAIDADGVLHIGLDSQGVMSAMGHELTHYIERTVSEESWAKFKKFLMDAADRHEARGFEKLVEKKMREYADEMQGLSEQDARALAESEAFASLCEDVLKDEGRMRQLMQEDRSLFKKVYKWINDVLDNLKGLISGDRGGIDAVRVRDDLEQIRDMWFELLNESRSSGKSAEGAEQYMKTVRFNKEDGSVTEYDDETGERNVLRAARNGSEQGLGTRNADKKTGVGSRFYVATDENLRGELETKVVKPDSTEHDTAEKISGKYPNALEVGAKYRVTSEDGTVKEMYYLGHGSFGQNITEEARHDAEMYNRAAEVFGELRKLKELNDKVKESGKRLEAISDKGSAEYKDALYDHNILLDELKEEFNTVRRLPDLDIGAVTVEENGLVMRGGFGVKRSENKNDFGYWIVDPYSDNGLPIAGQLSTYGEMKNGSLPIVPARTESMADAYDRIETDRGSVTEHNDETRKTTVIREARKSTYQQDQERILQTAREIEEAKAQREQAAYDDEIEYRTRPTATTDDIDEEHWKALGVTGENIYDEINAQHRHQDEMDAQREQAAYDDEIEYRTRPTATTDDIDEEHWKALEREIGEAFIDEAAREANEAELERIRQESDGTDAIKADLKGMRERMQNGTVTEADLVTQRQLLEKAEHRVELAKRAYEKALTEESETARKRAERRLQKATEQRDRIQRGVQRMEMMYERGGRVSKPMADMLPKTSLDKAKAMTEEKPRQTTVIRDGVEQTIETKIPKAVEDIVTGVNKVSRWAWLDPIRMMDKLAGKNRELRETLTKVFENPFNEAAKRYTTALQQNRANYLNQMKECGVLFEGATEAEKQKARAMSAAMQKYGEGVYYNELDERMNYGLEDLKREFPDDWQKIVRASEITREMYDEYIDRINEMLEEVYPNVIEHNETRRAKLEEYVKLATAREAHQYKEIGLIEQRLAHAEEQVKNNPNDREAQAILEYHQAQLENARKLAEKYATQADMRRVQMAEILDAVERGDDVRNRRLQRRADYFHHFNADNATGVEQLKRIWQSEDAEISPMLVGKTATTQPKSKWAGFMQHRSGEHTTYDAIGGMLKYMQAAERKLSFDPFIAHLTTMQKQLREAAHEGVNHDGVEITAANPMITWVEEWRNSIAGKSQNIDRFFTDKGVFGRKMVETFKWLNSRARSNAVLMNFHSAAVQVSNIANAKTFVPNEKHWLSAARQLVDMTFGKSNQSDALRAAMESSAFLQQRYGLDFADIATENLEDTTALKKLALKMLGMGDEFAGKYMWLAAYNQYIDGKSYDTGHTYRNAVEYADDITRRSSAGRGIGEQATMMNSSIVNLLSPFQLEVNNTFQNFKDQAAKKNWKGLANMFVTTNLMNSVFQAAFGDRPLPFDLINAVFQAFKAGFADDDDESEEEKSFGQKVWQTAKGIGVNSLAEVVNAAPMAGLATGFASDFFDEMLGDQSPTAFGSSNLGLGNLGDALINVKELASDFANGQWTSWDAFWTDFVQESDWMKIVLPWGGAQAQRSLKGIDALARGYSQKMNKDGELQVQFTIDRSNPFNWLKAPLLGKWVTKEGQAFLAGETKGMSAQDTAAMKESGLSASSFFDAMAQVKAAGKQKEVDEYGNTVVNGQTMQYRLMRSGNFDDETTMAMIGKMGGSALDKANAAVENGIPLKKWVTMMADFGEMQKDEDESKKDKFRNYIFADRDLDAKQREWLDRSVCGTTGERDYSSATWYELSKNATHYNMAKLAQADGISPEMALEWYGTAARKTVDAFGNEKGISNDEVRDLIFADERLSAEQKAAVERMLFKTEKTRDYSSEALYRLSANETKYKRATYAATKGVDAAVAEKWLNFYDEKVPDAAGVDRASHNKDAVVMAIAEDRTLSKSQREAVYEMLYPTATSMPDFRNADWTYMSQLGKTWYDKAVIAEQKGVPVSVYVKESKLYKQWTEEKRGSKKDGTLKNADKRKLIDSMGLPRDMAKTLYLSVIGKL